MSGNLSQPNRAAASEQTAAKADPFLEEAHAAFNDFVLRPEFPCVGAKAAFNSKSYELRVYGELASSVSTETLAADLLAFTRSDIRHASEYATFVAIFRQPESTDEVEFEAKMWEQLTALNHMDAARFAWDPTVQSDPTDPQFSFSFAGQALYVIGMHPNSSREARRFRWPAMIFNPHEQFERLRADGKWKRMQETIRERDLHLQGSINPMLSDFGEATEARQYSGRAVEEGWQAPFAAISPAPKGKCPFAH
jgi:FPC/CPF motif-containing protein YcgG